MILFCDGGVIFDEESNAIKFLERDFSLLK
jgi:hypothetical protein